MANNTKGSKNVVKDKKSKHSAGASKWKHGKKGSGEKSFFRVDDNRAMKAKKNKAFVKFNKSKIQANNAAKITKLNRNFDSLQTTTLHKKEKPKFVNPIKEATKQQEKINADLDAAIDKMSSAF